MEREIKILREKVQDLSEENLALREINVQFQLENFKLQQKIKRLESSECDQNVSVITFNDSTFDTNAEYLEEDHLVTKLKNAKPSNSRPSRQAAKRSYQNAFDDLEDETEQQCEDSLNIKQEEVTVEELKMDDYIAEPQSDNEDLLGDEVSPKDAATIVFKLAAKRGQLEKLKILDPGKQKDASFVNKTLDLFFTRVLLASSSARGHKCPKKPGALIRPALDPKKLELCRQAFIYRLKREELTFSAKQERLKNFFAYVNFKIQNARKLLQKKLEKDNANGIV